jgi:prevent-host-death family protein
VESISSVGVRENFAAVMEEVKSHPVVIKKNGKDQAVMMSVGKFRELQDIEDMMLGEIAGKLDKKVNYLSDKESHALLSKILDA